MYDTSDAAVRDLVAGRIDAVIGDPPVMQYAISRNAQWKLKFNAFADNNPDYPLLTGLGQVVFGLSKDNPELAKAVNAEIAKLWQNCDLKKIGGGIPFLGTLLKTVPVNYDIDNSGVISPTAAGTAVGCT